MANHQSSITNHQFAQRCLLSIVLCLLSFVNFAQTNPANDAEAAALLQKVSEKYKAYKNISAE